ncbi:Glutaredoxin [Gracilariopsis chorda]|uniref:Glutaredoxin n=1 Tax=Gracilariopsis chorda TaxID=448386 RepID=A0A2V3J5W3_9FLOR|nr:Glutaredoxin [Gracilariopsis chorda]|eukprot:PXF49818.1 Glutaredoxin [Gracilariopsis chorda]
MALSFVSTLGRLPLSPLGLGRSSARCAVRPRWFASSASIVDNAITENNVMVFSASYCPYCRQVKSLFNELDVDHTVWELDERADGDDIKGVLLEKTGQRTVPNVFIGGKHVGGCDDTMALYDGGKLLGMVNA